MTGRKTSESHFAISSLQSPVYGPRSPVSALCFLLGSQRLAQSVYTLPPPPYFLLGVLCPVEYSFHRSVIFSFTALFHGASPVKYRLDRKYISFDVKLFHGARIIVSPIFPSSPNMASFASLRKTFFIRFLKPKFNGKFQICLGSSCIQLFFLVITSEANKMTD